MLPVAQRPFSVLLSVPGREDSQPDTNPSQLRFAVQRSAYGELRREAESKRASREGGLGVNLSKQ